MTARLKDVDALDDRELAAELLVAATYVSGLPSRADQILRQASVRLRKQLMPAGMAMLRYNNDLRDSPFWVLDVASGAPTVTVQLDDDDRCWHIDVNTDNMRDHDPASHDSDGDPRIEVCVNAGVVYNRVPDPPPTLGLGEVPF